MFYYLAGILKNISISVTAPIFQKWQFHWVLVSATETLSFLRSEHLGLSLSLEIRNLATWWSELSWSIEHRSFPIVIWLHNTLLWNKVEKIVVIYFRILVSLSFNAKFHLEDGLAMPSFSWSTFLRAVIDLYTSYMGNLEK